CVTPRRVAIDAGVDQPRGVLQQIAHPCGPAIDELGRVEQTVDGRVPFAVAGVRQEGTDLTRARNAPRQVEVDAPQKFFVRGQGRRRNVQPGEFAEDLLV